MISRKDNLLKRPWQQRKFEYHRQKVQSALPAIDCGPPAYRNHVVTKLKKQQKEIERCKKIEQDNFLLLQKMNYIMKTSRVDNVWKTPQPNFLNRVALYNTTVPRIEDIDLTIDIEAESDIEEIRHGRKSKCTACTPQKTEALQTPEERVPWEPMKKPVGRVRSKSVPVRKAETLPLIMSHVPDSKKKPHSSKIAQENKVSFREMKKIDLGEAQSIVLTSGNLQVSLKFPYNSVVKFREKNKEKFLMGGLCCCKNYSVPVL